MISLDPCKPNPCNNGGNCSRDGKGGYNCACINGYSGQTCNDGIYKRISYEILLFHIIEDDSKDPLF